MSRRKRLILIEPYPEDNPYRMSQQEQRHIWFPKLSLPAIAAYTPPNWEVELWDESVRQIDYAADADLVGISVMTCFAPRAYEISKEFRRRGIKVVLGGVHPSFLPEEAIQHADCVVVGEAEDLWPQALADFEEGKLQPFYRMEQFPSLLNYKHPRVDLLDSDAYMTSQCSFTTRGCHFDCEFCSVSPFNGKSSRQRPVAEVVAELQRVKEWRRSQLVEHMIHGPIWQRISTTLGVYLGIEDGTIFAFVDDLHNSNRAYCRELWTALKDLNIKWGAQCTLFLGDEPEMVKLAADSGCVAMFVGMESVSEDSLLETNKPFNKVDQYEKQIRTFHDHGIMVNPGVIFGFDHDDESVFERTVEFLIKNHMELSYFNILTPLPGTALYQRMEAEGRIFDRDWSHYDGKHVVYYPKQMKPETLQEGFFWANRQFFSVSSIFKRITHTRQRFIPRLLMNRQFRSLVYRTTPKGRLSPLAEVLSKMQVKLPTLETENLIPNAMLALKERVSAVSEQIDRYLDIRVKKTEIKALRVDLEGTLDLLGARELKERLILGACKAKMDIVVNFAHLRHATPGALQSLVDKDFLRKISPYARIRYLNFTRAFEEAISHLSLAGLESAQEESVA